MGCGSSTPEAAGVAPMATNPAKTVSAPPAPTASAPEAVKAAPAQAPPVEKPAQAAQPEAPVPAEVLQGANAPGDEKPAEKAAAPADENPAVMVGSLVSGMVASIAAAAGGYLDDSKFEQGHSIIAEKIARDKGAWAEMNAKATPPAEGASFPIAIIADQDEASIIDESGVRRWISKLLTGNLVYNGDKGAASYTLEVGPESTLRIDHGDKSGRGAEYSALEVFDGKLLTMDDRTGDVDEIFPNQEANDADAAYLVKPLVNAEGNKISLRLGDGKKDKPLKAEWATQKAGKLVIGSTGKERTDDDSNVVHHGEMWIKTLEPGTLALTNIDGTQGYNGLRESALVGPAPAEGQKSVGYMIHESGRWSDVHQKWFFLPRKLSRESYNEVSDNHKCVNLMLAAPDFLPGAGINPEYGNCLMQPYLGFLDTRGCSDFLFVPGSNDSHIFLMRTEESMEGTLTSYSSVIDLAANVLMAESKIMDDRKFEGAAWVGGWAGFKGAGATPSAAADCAIQ